MFVDENCHDLKFKVLWVRKQCLKAQSFSEGSFSSFSALLGSQTTIHYCFIFLLETWIWCFLYYHEFVKTFWPQYKREVNSVVGFYHQNHYCSLDKSDQMCIIVSFKSKIAWSLRFLKPSCSEKLTSTREKEGKEISSLSRNTLA